MPSLQQNKRVRCARNARRSGFTLVEVLVVIAIIGVLVALIVPAVNMAYRTVQQRAIALECQALAQAVEAYRNKYDDYPPDGLDQGLMKRHFGKAFPNLAPSEITLLSNPAVVTGNAAIGSVMEPSEALVFFLGGFSDDPAFPFSGKGGPIYIDNGSGVQIKSDAMDGNSVFQYNPDRQKPFYDFKQAQLTLDVGGVPPRTISTDDDITGAARDLMPAYHPSGKKMPFLYFDSRTYQPKTDANQFATLSAGIAYPYRSTAVNTKYSANDNSVLNRNKYFRFMNENTFQIISAGLDDNYGGEPPRPSIGKPGLFYMFKPSNGESAGSANSGDSLELTAPISSGTHPTPEFTRFLNSTGTSQLDNVTNFSEGKLEDSLSN
jgi:prepilin-type N-terminal cleavage/methylation domain-containing protein